MCLHNATPVLPATHHGVLNSSCRSHFTSGKTNPVPIPTGGPPPPDQTGLVGEVIRFLKTGEPLLFDDAMGCSTAAPVNPVQTGVPVMLYMKCVLWIILTLYMPGGTEELLSSIPSFAFCMSSVERKLSLHFTRASKSPQGVRRCFQKADC